MPLGIPSRTYFPGELIHKEVPFVKILPRAIRGEFCETCHCRWSNLRFCVQCLAVKYCGKVCQKKDWKDHRLECKNMKNLEEQKGVDVVRLLGRVIHKIKGREWKSIKATVLGTEVNFDDIDPHYKEMTENPILNLLYKELQDRTRKFIGAENTPSDIDMLKIIGKVIYNSLLSNQEYPGVCFFLGMFVFEKQCIPNSSFVVYKNSLKVWANKEIVKNSEKISISYRRLFDEPLHICKEIDKQPCHCSDCSLPYGESVLSKILDDKKAYSVIAITENFLQNKDMTLALEFVEPAMKLLTDEILEMHSGVLGRTNVLHLRMLGVRHLVIGGRLREIEPELKCLEDIVRSVFGEFSSELLLIYTLLAAVYKNLRLPGLAFSHALKAQVIAGHFSEV